MKRLIMALFILIIVIFPVKALAAANPTVQADVVGDVQKGKEIQIVIKVSNISSFFAGSVDFKYDKTALSIKSITPGDLITQKDANGNALSTFPVNDSDLNDGIASYGFSCLGKINGFSGSGIFVTIDAIVLSDASLNINSKTHINAPDDSNNLKIILCDSNIKELDYNFIAYGKDINTSTSDANGSADANIGSASGTSTGGQASNITSANAGGQSNSNGDASSSKTSPGTSTNSNPDGLTNGKSSGNSSSRLTQGNVNTTKLKGNDVSKNNVLGEIKTNSSLYIIIAVVILIVGVGGVGTFIYLRKKKA